MAKNPAFGIEKFASLVQHVWGTTCEDSLSANLSEGPDADVRRLLASFGATWDRAWMLNNEDIWEQLTWPDGAYNGYAVCHRHALKLVEVIGNGKLAPRVEETISEGRKGNKDVEKGSDGDDTELVIRLHGS